MLRQTIVPTKIPAKIRSSLWLFILLLLICNNAIAASPWRELIPGIEYQDVEGNYLTPWSHVHAFRINLNHNQLSVITAKDLQREYASVDEYAQFSQALLAINGGFFDDNFQPLGLRIRNKRQINPLKSISWWGVFYIKNNHAYLSNVHQFKANKQSDFAVQSGPRILINGQIPPLKAGRAERTALGITTDGHIIILVSEHAAMSTTELAQLMKAPPLNCLHALNLDGGSSSQLYAKIKSFQVQAHGFANVSDAIVVKAKK